MPNVVWTEEARTDLAGIRGYIGQFSPLNAQRFSAKLVSAVESLVTMPDRGRRCFGWADAAPERNGPEKPSK